jgi:hypothetical protein
VGVQKDIKFEIKTLELLFGGCLSRRERNLSNTTTNGGKVPQEFLISF